MALKFYLLRSWGSHVVLIMFDNNPIPHCQCLCSDIVKDLIKKTKMIATKELRVIV